MKYGNLLTGFREHNLDIAQDCVFNKKYQCNVQIDLSDYENEDLDYSFNVSDIAFNSKESRKTKVKADVTDPSISSFNSLVEKQRVKFIFDIIETNFAKITYIDNSDLKPKEKTLCTSLKNRICSKTISLKEGNHELDFNITDKAGNNIIQLSSIFIDSIKPRIIKTEPTRGFTNGTFLVEFKEENPSSLVINYGNIQTGMKFDLLDISQDCVFDGTKYRCEEALDLHEYDEQQIEYTFKLTDVVGQFHESLKRKVTVQI